MREFLHVDDMAAASIFVANVSQETYESCTEPMLSHINVGTGVDCTIAELALTMAEVVGYQGNVTFDATKPDGAPRKLMNVDTLKRLGWSYTIELKDGLASTYEWFLAHQDDFRG
jgi:GDP-L-fucose synthase